MHKLHDSLVVASLVCAGMILNAAKMEYQLRVGKAELQEAEMGRENTLDMHSGTAQGASDVQRARGN